MATCATAGLVLLVAASIVWFRGQPAPNEGVTTVDALAATSTPPAMTPASALAMPSATPPAMPSAASSGSGSAVPVTSGHLPTLAPVVRPVRIVLADFGVDAPVVAAGVAADGEFAVPSDIHTVGWYRYGPGLDATAGSVFIGGHVDSAAAGPGAFYHLRDLAVGATIVVVGSDARRRAFRVVAREEYPKAVIDLGRYFSSTGAFRLTLMTCGGSFDRTARSYRDNIAVTAVPA